MRAEAESRKTDTNPSYPAMFVEERNNVLLDPKNVDQIFFIMGSNNCELKKKLEIKLKQKIPENMTGYTLYEITKSISSIILPPIIRNNEQTDKARLAIGIILDECTKHSYTKISINTDIQDYQSYFTFKKLIQEIFFDTGIELTIYVNKVITVTDINEIETILEAYHRGLLGGHSGFERMFNKIKRFYNWINIKNDIKRYIQNCEICEKTKTYRHTKTPIQIAEVASRPFERVFIDLVGPITPTSEKGNKYIFTCECELTKFAIAIPITDAGAYTTARTFMNEILLKYLLPEEVLMDNGTNFTSDLFTNMNKLLIINKKHITAFNPKANMVERLHKTLNAYLRAFTKEDPDNWDEYIVFAIHSYNCTPHTTTKYAPQELLFGTLTQIPTKITKKNTPTYTYDSYIDELRVRLKHSHEIAKERQMDRKEVNAEYKNKWVNPIDLSVGDNVLLLKRNRENKFDEIYEGPYKVIELVSATSVKIKKGNKTPVVLRNHLKKSIINKE